MINVRITVQLRRGIDVKIRSQSKRPVAMVYPQYKIINRCKYMSDIRPINIYYIHILCALDLPDKTEMSASSCSPIYSPVNTFSIVCSVHHSNGKRSIELVCMTETGKRRLVLT